MSVRCTMCGWLGEFKDLHYVVEPDYDSGYERSWDYVPHCPRCFSSNGFIDLEE